MIKLKNLLKEDYKQVIASYVNDFKDRGLSKIKNAVPADLKYEGPAFHLCTLPKKSVLAILEGKSIPYPPKKVLSWAKTIEGLSEAYYNLSQDFPSKYAHGVIIKGKITKDQCIVDVGAFADTYPDIVSDTQYADYALEEEVITMNLLTTINKGMLDGYILDGKPKQVK